MTSRYDLPLVPPMAWLATQGLLWLPRLALPLVVVAVSVTSLWCTTPALLRYGADGSPIGRAMADLAAAGHRPAIAAHHVFVRAFEADGRMGLQRLASEHPDLVVLDLMMPVVDGSGVLDEMRERADATPVSLKIPREGPRSHPATSRS